MSTINEDRFAETKPRAIGRSVPWVLVALFVLCILMEQRQAGANAKQFRPTINGEVLARPSESVRAELSRMEEKSGLTLTAYFKGPQVVSSKRRRKFDGKGLVRIEDGPGTMSPDGSKVVLSVVHWEGSD